MLPNEVIAEPLFDCEIVSQRTFKYSPSKVFDALQNPEKLKAWWGPDGFTNTFHLFDFKEGGHWKFVMHGPDGAAYDNECAFIKIEKPSLIVMNHVVAPLFQVQASFEGDDLHTELTFKMIFLSADLCDQLKPVCIPANEQNFNRLEKVLEQSDK
jgi:hypothetical protein